MSAALSPIDLDLDKYLSQSYGGGKQKYFVLTYRIRSSIAKQLGGDIFLEGIEPDTLFVDLTETIDKKVPVKLFLKADFERQYMQSGGVVIEPDKILLKGPKSVLDTISEVLTKPLKFSEINQKIVQKVSLVPIPQVSFSTRSVMVTVPVEKYTELTVTVPVEIENQPDGVKLFFLPKSVDVKCNVILSKYFALKPRMFKAVVDYNLINKSINKKLKVKIVTLPEYTSLVDFNPKYVEYIIADR